ncbi:MAG TPA: response regulator transcription factor [Candidatus Limnocylindrales bacterium]|jgi:DNA-binding NarL/FixJ family response regulator|nr:response regulator transcription factor [Candidatus Limnocylindrales bacterium]
MPTRLPAVIHVLLVDDQQLLTDALARLLELEADVAVVGVAASLAALRQLEVPRVEVVLMDYRLPDGTGAEGTRIVRSRWRSARVIMLTAITDDETILESIQAGADGYLTKDRAAEDVVAAVRAARAGEILLPRPVVLDIAERVAAARGEAVARRRPAETLTPRELEVLRALVEGTSSREICARLFISTNTLRTHTQNIIGKLQVHSKLEAVAYALRTGLIEPPRPEP